MYVGNSNADLLLQGGTNTERPENYGTILYRLQFFVALFWDVYGHLFPCSYITRKAYLVVPRMGQACPIAGATHWRQHAHGLTQ